MCVKALLINVKDKNASLLGFSVFNKYLVPCGKCPECIKAKCNAWLFRLDKELERSSNPLFITLTYATENLTYGESAPTLVKRDTQLFFKKLRNLTEKKYGKSAPKIKYYLCGEYGSKNNRPHYHIIMFNLLDSTLINDAWQRGFTLTLPLRAGGTAYVLKYMYKPHKKIKGIEPEFSLMSKNMGDNYLTPAMIKYHHSSVENAHVTTVGGFKMAMPKYYKEKLFTDVSPIKRKEVTEYLQKRSEENVEKQLKSIKDRYPTKDKYFHIDILENQKKNLKFTKRLTEVL